MSTMKGFDAFRETGRGNPQAQPQFELEYLVDDIDSPTEILVVPYATGYSSETEWIMADIRHAVPLEWVR